MRSRASPTARGRMSAGALQSSWSGRSRTTRRGRSCWGRIRSASSHPQAAALVRETVAGDLSRLTEAISDDRPHTRAVLVGAQLVGLALARYVVLVEPLASLPPAEVVALIAPVFQHYLVGPLSSGAAAPAALDEG